MLGALSRLWARTRRRVRASLPPLAPGGRGGGARPAQRRQSPAATGSIQRARTRTRMCTPRGSIVGPLPAPLLLPSTAPSARPAGAAGAHRPRRRRLGGGSRSCGADASFQGGRERGGQSTAAPQGPTERERPSRLAGREGRSCSCGDGGRGFHGGEGGFRLRGTPVQGEGAGERTRVAGAGRGGAGRGLGEHLVRRRRAADGGDGRRRLRAGASRPGFDPNFHMKQ